MKWTAGAVGLLVIQLSKHGNVSLRLPDSSGVLYYSNPNQPRQGLANRVRLFFGTEFNDTMLTHRMNHSFSIIVVSDEAFHVVGW
jgi:hypothetical protein